MAVNLDKPHLWKQDVRRSVDFYNEWFLEFAPRTFREERIKATERVEDALRQTRFFREITPDVLMTNPGALEMLRQGTAPPIARDRLVGLADVNKSMVERMEREGKLPVRMNESVLREQLSKAGGIIRRLADPDILVWLEDDREPTAEELRRAATVIADRLTGAVADPIIRNAQERRQLEAMKAWLEHRGYVHLLAGEGTLFDDMEPGTFSFRLNIPVGLSGTDKTVNIPVDAAVQPVSASRGDMPLLIEAKSAGDFTNTNKRRKEEAQKIGQLRTTYGDDVRFILFLCGYFDAGYLGYEASEGIDWVWEHRIDDLAAFGL